jgi:hypothetical protein
MERKLSPSKASGTAEQKRSEEITIPTPVKVLIGGLAIGIIKNSILEDLLDAETHHEFSSNIIILTEFVKWFQNPEIRILKSRDHVRVFRYLLSVYLRAYHRNVKNQILLKLSRLGEVKVILNNELQK